MKRRREGDFCGTDFGILGDGLAKTGKEGGVEAKIRRILRNGIGEAQEFENENSKPREGEAAGVDVTAQPENVGVCGWLFGLILFWRIGSF